MEVTDAVLRLAKWFWSSQPRILDLVRFDLNLYLDIIFCSTKKDVSNTFVSVGCHRDNIQRHMPILQWLKTDDVIDCCLTAKLLP